MCQERGVPPCLALGGCGCRSEEQAVFQGSLSWRWGLPGCPKWRGIHLGFRPALGSAPFFWELRVPAAGSAFGPSPSRQHSPSTRTHKEAGEAASAPSSSATPCVSQISFWGDCSALEDPQSKFRGYALLFPKSYSQTNPPSDPNGKLSFLLPNPPAPSQPQALGMGWGTKGTLSVWHGTDPWCCHPDSQKVLLVSTSGSLP